MEGVEEANRLAVESSKKLVALLSRSGDPFRLMAAAAETDDAVSRFGKVVTILSNRVGHARARIGKRSLPPVDPSLLLDRPLPTRRRTPALPSPAPARSVVQIIQEKEAVAAAVAVAPAKNAPVMTGMSLFLETPFLESSSGGAASTVSVQNSSRAGAAPAASPPSAPRVQFQQQQMQQQKSFQFEQKLASDKFHIEMPPRSGGGGGGGAVSKEVISFSFDNNSVCTSSASFFTSISSQLVSMSDAGTNSAAAAPSSSKKAACSRKGGDDDGSGKCHCPKKKKPREKRAVRVPAISDKIADIPEDNYSWRKYGQKPIKGSPHPRGYYRCSSIKDCPARKHVERCRGDAAMLIVTYENEHIHARPLDLSMLDTIT